MLRYTHFDKKKNTHINGCKIIYKYTVTVTCAFNILVFFGSVGYVRERDSEWENNKKIIKEWIFY